MFEQRIERSPKTDLTNGLPVSALGHLGRDREAKRIRTEPKTLNPKYSFTAPIERLAFSEPAVADRIRDGYAKAGVRAS